ncbi:MAG: HU family DNA-binding protein [Phycisphaeraceae bacterium]|nr:HU family DNA-binding protein [Phycisphaeraceae bacterium]
MNKGDLVDAVAEEMRVTKAEATKAVEAVFACLGRGLAERAKVTIAGFGTFQAKTRPPRNGVHPITREPMQIAETKTCTFRAAPALKETL